MFNASPQTDFTLTISNVRHDLQVLAFTGNESISKPYTFDVERVSVCPDFDFESLLHKQTFWGD